MYNVNHKNNFKKAPFPRGFFKISSARYYFTIGKLVFLLITPVVLLLLPGNFFDNGRDICLSKILFHRECWGCGMTRACMHIIHFQFEDAFMYNMGSFIVFPILCYLWVDWFLKELKKIILISKKTVQHL